MKSETLVRRSVDRRGIVLILALGMLALFTVVAITLASISRTQATAAGNFKRLEQYGSNTLTVREDEVIDLFRYAINQLVYDTRNRQSAIRGHSLLRDMYGSPTNYSLNYNTGTGAITNINAVAADGAELRLRQSDLRRLLNISLNNNNDPRLLAIDYQKVYNGTGVFPPRKMNLSSTTSGLTFSPTDPTTPKATDGITATAILDSTTNVSRFAFQLTNPEIAAQTGFMNVPGRLMPRTPTIYPDWSDSASWRSILLSPNGAIPNGSAYWLPLFPINYTEFDAFMPNTGTITRAATAVPIDPERFTYVSSILGTPRNYPQGDHWFGADEDYDYPDINNMFLAMERADGKMLIPSFHRPGIIAQVADGVNTLTSYGATGAFIGKLPWFPYNSNSNSANPPADFHGLVLRPRAADRDPKTLGIPAPRAGQFREMADAYVHLTNGTVKIGQDGLPDDLDGSGFIGDHPSELDVDTDGDGLNDSIWVDIGAPVIQVGDSALKPLFAFKVVGLDGKINLNAHGNLYKVPTPQVANKTSNWGPTTGINYTLMHKSNLGASPTEINPQYGILLSDNDGTYPATNLLPPFPVWGFAAPSTSYPLPNPYQRLLEGYTNLYTGDQAPGRWSGIDPLTGTKMDLPGYASYDDNGNLTNPDPSVKPSLTTGLPTIASREGFDPSIPTGGQGGVFGQNWSLSSGDGNIPIPTLTLSSPSGYVEYTYTVAGRQPANQGPFSPLDLNGIGTRFSPFSNVVQGATGAHSTIIANAMGNLAATDQSLVSLYLNYAEISGVTIGSKIQSLDDGSAPVSPVTMKLGGLSVERLLANEAAEINLYSPGEDLLFTATDVAGLLRANDFDGSANQSRLVGLLPDQLGVRPIEISSSATTPTPSYLPVEGYAKNRMRHLFTHESWDLIRYNTPPTFHSSSDQNGLGYGLFLGPAVPGSPGELIDIAGDTNYLVNNPVEAFFARSHSGESGPNFISQLLNNKLPGNVAASGVSPITAGGSSPYSVARDVYEQLCTTQTSDGRDFLIPYEVQMGRRMDLNRPLTAYTSANANTADPKGVSVLLMVDAEREGFAQQIYVLLALASGACGVDPHAAASQMMTPQARLAQSRTLAQIAVNIVDYMDPDNVMTMMRFDPDLSDGWDDPKSTTKSLVDSAGSKTISPGTQEYVSVTTVLGFEMPQLVINESLSLVTEDQDKAAMGMPPIRNEYLFSWIELFNPWPDAVDPVDNNPGTALVANGEPVFMLQLNRLDASVPNAANATSPPLLPPIEISSISAPLSQIVMFNGTVVPAIASLAGSAPASDGGLVTSGMGTPVARVMGRNGSGTRPGYFVVGPSDLVRSSLQTNKNITFPTGLSNDYTASACAFEIQNNANTPTPQVDVKLYRKRNPFAKFDAITNPYVVIDAISQQFQTTDPMRKYSERSLDSSVALKTPTIPAAQSGLYFVKDTSTDSDTALPRPSWTSGVTAPTPPYVSLQRLQPWHGYNSDWQPIRPGSGSTHPFLGTALGATDQNIEGAFLGLPSLSDARRFSKTATPPAEYANTDDTNGMRQSGFMPASNTLGAVNSNAYKRWESFPFLNRQLATPLELLNVRLYGSHMWFLAGNVHEWRLRFTDDFEFFPHPWVPQTVGGNAYFERMWRSRDIPWYQDNRLSHATFPQLTMPTASVGGAFTYSTALPTLSTVAAPPQVQLPLPHLYRFFEFVECRSRMNNGVPANQQWVELPISGSLAWPADLPTVASAPTYPPGLPSRGTIVGGVTPAPLAAAAPASVLATQRSERTPGKINLNLVTDEEVYRALLDSVETAYYDLTTDYIANNTGYQTGTGNFSIAVSSNYWPPSSYSLPNTYSYWNSLFTPLGLAPLDDPTKGTVLGVVDVLGRMVAWSTITLNNTPGVTVTTPPLAGSAAAPVISTGGFDLLAMQLYTGSVAQSTSMSVVSTNSASLANLAVGSVFRIGSPNNQFPGIINGADLTMSYMPGTNPDRQVHSEMYRAFLLSRAGADGIHGTADDKPFRSFASDDVSDTILRTRNAVTSGLVREGAVFYDKTSTKLMSPSLAEAQAVVACMYLDGSDDIVNANIGSAISFYAGDYMNRLGGQRTPGLFDPIADPYSEDNSGAAHNYASTPHLMPIGADPTDPAKEFLTRIPNYTSGSADKLPVDYWVLEERRNELLAKISGNVTTRSHVFAVWVAVGFFRVEPGTEGLKVPLLGAEVGSETGKAFRHRAFFIIDRSQAKAYDPEDIDANFDFEIMRQKKLLEYYKIIE